MPSLFAKNVFINCPFDVRYKPLFDGLVFAIYDLGFIARCALEEDDGGDFRLAKIERIIEDCKFGIHDLSAVALDAVTNLPRFNMPLEFGLFLGCRRYGGEQQEHKKTLILDSDAFRYRQFISDISGQDVHAHRDEPRQAIIEVRNWLSAASGRKGLSGGAEIADRYGRFRADLPALCAKFHREAAALTFLDLSELVVVWLKSNR